MKPDVGDRIKSLSPQKRALLEKLLKEKGVDPGGIPLIRQRSSSNTPPMSFAQQRLWFFDQFDPGNTIYNGPMFYRIRGSLNIPALEASLNLIIERHEVLRSNFDLVKDEPCQIIREHIPFNLEIEDLSNYPGQEREQLAKQRGREERSHSFELAQEILFRARLLRMGVEEHILLMTSHHIVFDGWSAGILWQELSAIYPALAEGKECPLPDLSIQYGDYAQWQRNWFSGRELDRQMDYWKDRLHGLNVLDLPSDRSRPQVQTYRGSACSHQLDESLCQELAALAQKENASDFMVMLAILKVLLARLSGQDNFAVGSPIAGRQRTETEGLIGMFVNTLVLRSDQQDLPSFRELLRRVRKNVLEAFQHQDLPFEKLVLQLQPKRDLSRTPLFQVMFNAMNFSHQGPELTDLMIEEFSITEEQEDYDPGAKFDLTLYAIRGREGTRLVAAYNADLFDKARMSMVLSQFEKLARQVVEAPDRPVVDYSLHVPVERKSDEPVSKDLGEGGEVSLVHRIEEQVNHNGGNVALVDTDGQWTYAELWESTHHLAGYLRAQGLGKGDVVAILADRSASLVWALLGIIKAGGVFLILDPAHPVSRLTSCLEQSKARFLISLDGVPKDLEEDLKGCGEMILVDGDPRNSGPWNDELTAIDAFYPRPDDHAYIAFTSGTTGLPLGILGTHAPLSHFFRWQSKRFDLKQSDHFSLLSGLAHDPLLRDVFTPLCLGATLHIPEADVIPTGRLADWMRQERITIAHMTPAMGDLLVSGLGSEGVPGSNGPPTLALRYLFFGGDRLTGNHVRAMQKCSPGIRIVNVYGATETPQVASLFEVKDSQEDFGSGSPVQAVPIGGGAPGMKVRVVDRTGNTAGVGELGEIVVESSFLCRGYLNEESLTKQKFRNLPGDSSSNMVYHTGDLGRYLPNDQIAFVGRKDRQVKMRGYRVELDEIQSRAAQFPGVQRCVTVFRQGEENEDGQVVVYFQIQPESVLDTDQWKMFLKGQLPDHMVPNVFVQVDTLPMTPSGKIDEAALPVPDRARPALKSGFVAPGSLLEKEIGTVWKDLLNLEQVGVGDNFFDLGGHSLLVVKLQTRLQTQLQREVSLVDLFKHPTIALQAAHLNQNTPQQAPGSQITDLAVQRRKARTQHGNRMKQIRKGNRKS